MPDAQPTARSDAQPTARPDAEDVINLLLDPKVQKEIARVNPTFNRAELVAAVFEAWGGQNLFAKDVYKLYCTANQVTQANIMSKIMTLISEESKNKNTRDVEDMTDEELGKAILTIAPGLKGIANGPGKP